MSDIKVVLVTADAREDKATTAGTKAWQLFADDADVIARGSRRARPARAR